MYMNVLIKILKCMLKYVFSKIHLNMTKYLREDKKIIKRVNYIDDSQNLKKKYNKSYKFNIIILDSFNVLIYIIPGLFFIRNLLVA